MLHRKNGPSATRYLPWRSNPNGSRACANGSSVSSWAVPGILAPKHEVRKQKQPQVGKYVGENMKCCQELRLVLTIHVDVLCFCFMALGVTFRLHDPLHLSVQLRKLGFFGLWPCISSEFQGSNLGMLGPWAPADAEVEDLAYFFCRIFVHLKLTQKELNICQVSCDGAMVSAQVGFPW